MNKIHVIMPFSRLHLKDTLIEAYRPMGIILYPIMFKEEYSEFNEDWIVPVYIPEYDADCDCWGKGAYKRNWFIENCEIHDNDYYLTADDDDMYEPDVMDRVKQFDDDIVIISLKRGDHTPEGVTPERCYETSTLFACPENVRIGGISSQQSFVKGKIFKKYLFITSTNCADGKMAIKHKEDGEQTRYEPYLFALFNYYEPGRWEINNGDNGG